MSVLIYEHKEEKKPELKVESVVIPRPQVQEIWAGSGQLESKTESPHNKHSPLARKMIKGVRATVKGRHSGMLNIALGALVGGACGAPAISLLAEGLTANRTFTFPNGRGNVSLQPRSRHNDDNGHARFDQVMLWGRIVEKIHYDRIYDPIVDTATLEDILDKSRMIKQKGRYEWITMEEVVPYWAPMINQMFKQGKVGRDNTKNVLLQLNNSEACIMGEADNNASYKKHGHSWGKCGGCSWLATGGLHLFSSYGRYDTVDPYLTSEDGWNEYKARFEYHWNVFHRE